MKKLALVTIMALLLPLCVFAGGSAESADDGTITIGISKLMSHSALDAAEQGCIDYLESTGLPVEFQLQNANGDVSTAASIAQQFRTSGCDIVLGIATGTAQALANVFDDIPVVFAAVTDPVDAGLVPTMEGSSDVNVCGVSDMNPVEEQIRLLVDITGAETIGNIYASGEANGVTLMEQAKAACEAIGVDFVEVAISNSSEVRQAAQSIVDRVDAIYIATDNAVISALPAVDEVCSDAGIPLMSADPSGVEGLDCMISWGFDYYSLGVATGELIEQIINGAEPGPLGTVILEDPADFELWFNLDTAAKLGIEIPQEYLDMASVIIEDGVQTRV